MDCTSGKSASVVECTLMDEAPEVDRICLSVIANEKISTMCAVRTDISQITLVQDTCASGSPPLSAEPLERYCFD